MFSKKIILRLRQFGICLCPKAFCAPQKKNQDQQYSYVALEQLY